MTRIYGPKLFNSFFFEVTTHTLPYLKCNGLVSVRSSLPCIDIGVHVELTLFFPQRILKTILLLLFCGLILPRKIILLDKQAPRLVKHNLNFTGDRRSSQSE